MKFPEPGIEGVAHLWQLWTLDPLCHKGTSSTSTFDLEKYQVCYIYVMYSALKKKEILTFATTWMNLEDITLREISPSQKDKHSMIPLI